MTDAVELLQNKQKNDGPWILNSGMSGRKYFDLEKAGQPNRWNTLRAGRVLNWWDKMILPLLGYPSEDFTLYLW
jgi:hypothetical protein